MVKSNSTHKIIVNPLRTEVKRLPTQLILGAVTDGVQTVAENLKIASEAIVIGNMLYSIVMNGALGAMYTMINSF